MDRLRSEKLLPGNLPCFGEVDSFAVSLSNNKTVFKSFFTKLVLMRLRVFQVHKLSRSILKGIVYLVKIRIGYRGELFLLKVKRDITCGKLYFKIDLFL